MAFPDPTVPQALDIAANSALTSLLATARANVAVSPATMAELATSAYAMAVAMEAAAGGGGGSSPWLGNVDAGGFSLSNLLNLAMSGTLTIASGAPVVKIISATGVLDFGSTAAGASSDLTITLTGAVDGDCVQLGVPIASQIANGVYTAFVSAPDTVTVRFTNPKLVGALDPASGTFRVAIIGF